MLYYNFVLIGCENIIEIDIYNFLKENNFEVVKTKFESTMEENKQNYFIEFKGENAIRENFKNLKTNARFIMDFEGKVEEEEKEGWIIKGQKMLFRELINQ